MDRVEFALYVFTKLAFLTLRIVWPIYTLGYRVWLPLFVCSELVQGGYLAFVFQVRCTLLCLCVCVRVFSVRGLCARGLCVYMPCTRPRTELTFARR